jgi:hypothetical protein
MTYPSYSIVAGDVTFRAMATELLLQWWFLWKSRNPDVAEVL